MLTRFLQFIILLLPFMLLVRLFWIEFVPSGVFAVQHSVGQSSAFIDALAPANRVREVQKQAGKWVQAIIDDPVFFFVHPHRRFDRVAFEIWFQNTSAPIVEFGGLVQTKPGAYNLQSLHNLLIDELSWPKVTQDGITLYQKQTTYNSLEAFYANPPAKEQIAVYKTEYKTPFRLPGYVPSNTPSFLDISLRGAHEFKTYIKAETLRMNISYMDMNRDEGADPFVITVFDEQGKPVADARAGDDGNTHADAIPSVMQSIALEVPGLSEGVYKISVNVSRDIFLRKIETAQSKLILLNHVYVGDEVAYQPEPHPTILWTASKQLRMQTRHASGVQEVTHGEQTFLIQSPFELYLFETTGTLAPLTLQQGDMEIYVDGPVAISKSQYFQPDPVPLRAYTDVEQQGINYILTSYQPPQWKDGWLVKTLEFETAPLVFDKNSWKFTFSTPKIGEQGELLIHQINPTFFRAPFRWEDFFKKLKEVL